MQWEHLTSSSFANAVESTRGTAIFPLGVLEAHGAHLPLGQDMLTAHAVACRAAETEPAIVFPAYPLTLNDESAHLSGSVVLPRDLMLALFDHLCTEMGRNGLRRIIIYSGHGGNSHMIPFYMQTYREKPRPFLIYFANIPYFTEEEVAAMATDELGHACEAETSVALYLHEDLVHMDALPEPFTNLKRTATLNEAHLQTPFDWYGMYPTMYVGDAAAATAQKGQRIVERQANALAQAIGAVKEDQTLPALAKAYDAGRENPGSAY